jgi:hypothetical protein
MVVDGNYGPAPSISASEIPAGFKVIRLADAPLSLAYDRIAPAAANERLIFVGTGCRVGRPDMDSLRSKLTRGQGAVTLVPPRSGSSVELDGRSVIGIGRRLLIALGGFAVTENRARRVGAGFVGSGDLFEVFLHEVRRAGWSIEHIPQIVTADQSSRPPNATPAATATATAAAAVTVAVADASDASLPPSRRIGAGLRAATGPIAGMTVDWFSDFIPEAQVEALAAVVGPRRPAPDRGGWDALAVARMLWWRGQRPYAAQLLERADLGRYVEPAHISDIVLILSEAGTSVTTLVTKLGHAEQQLAAVMAAQPVDQANKMLLEWWEMDPGAGAAYLGVLALAPTLSLVDAVGWHDRIRLVSRESSPLLSIARDGSRLPFDRAVAARCLEIDDPTFSDSALLALLAGLDQPVREAIDRAAQKLLGRARAVASH